MLFEIKGVHFIDTSISDAFFISHAKDAVVENVIYERSLTSTSFIDIHLFNVSIKNLEVGLPGYIDTFFYLYSQGEAQNLTVSVQNVFMEHFLDSFILMYTSVPTFISCKNITNYVKNVVNITLECGPSLSYLLFS